MKDCELLDTEINSDCSLFWSRDKKLGNIVSPHCEDNNCYYKQLLAEQAKNKKLVEALELIMNNDDEPSFENYTATQALLANEVNNAK